VNDYGNSSDPEAPFYSTSRNKAKVFFVAHRPFTAFCLLRKNRRIIMRLSPQLQLFCAVGVLLIGCAEDPDEPLDQNYGYAGTGGNYILRAGGAIGAGTTEPIAGLSGGATASNPFKGGGGDSTIAGNGGTEIGGTKATGGAGATSNTGPCVETCPAPNGGLTISCKKRFMYGVNYAWGTTVNNDGKFGTDFGGKAAWSQKGVDGERDRYVAQIKEMKENGIDAIRWWMFPALKGDGIVLDANRTPTGLGSTVEKDINAALEIAKEQDVHIKFTLFSFDNFRPDTQDTLDTGPIVTDNIKRAALMEKVVRKIAAIVESNPNKDRVIAWDVINEPEWAIKAEKDPYGDPPFDGSMSNMNFISFAQMEAFIKDVVVAIKAESKAPVTVGSAAVKWAKAWSKVGLDYHDFHWYGWVDQWFPHTKTPAEYGVDDLPVVVGEFPLIPNGDTTGQAFGGISYGQLIDDFFAAGYAGALGWAYNTGSADAATFGWSASKANVKAWADAHPCYTHY
jgi:hypothetical protein